MNQLKKKYEQLAYENQRNYLKFKLLEQWMKLSLAGVRLGEFLEEFQLGSVAIYGIGELGRLFYDDMAAQGLGFRVKYGIDRDESVRYKDLPVYALEHLPQRTDAIIISPVLITDGIEDHIYERLGEQQTYTIEEILYELSRKHRIRSELWDI